MTKKRNSRTVYAVLGFLADKPRSGYEIKKAIDDKIGFFWSESYGQIYPILKKLVDKGLAEKIPANADDGRKKQFYKITDLGKDEFQEWLKLPADYNSIRNEILLKLFFGANADKETNLNHLRSFKESNQSLINDLKQLDNQENTGTYQQAVLAYGANTSKVSVKWANETINRLTKLSS